MEEFNALGHHLNDIRVVATGALASLPTIPRDGTLVRERTSFAVYQLQDGVLRWITSRAAFDTAGFSLDDVQVVANGALPGIRVGEDLTPDEEGGAQGSAADGVTAMAASVGAPSTVQRYAPMVYFHPDERYPAISADAFMSRARLRWAHDGGCGDHPHAEAGQVQSGRLGSGGYTNQIAAGRLGFCNEHGRRWSSNQFTRPLDRSKQRERGVPLHEGFFLEVQDARHVFDGFSTGVNAPAYYEYHPGFYVTYWFFYASTTRPGRPTSSTTRATGRGSASVSTTTIGRWRLPTGSTAIPASCRGGRQASTMATRWPTVPSGPTRPITIKGAFLFLVPAGPSDKGRRPGQWLGNLAASSQRPHSGLVRLRRCVGQRRQRRRVDRPARCRRRVNTDPLPTPEN
jgi:hypothetical protein